MQLQPIGTIRTPFTELEGMPIQPAGAAGVVGTIEIAEPYVAALADLDGFSHVFLLYHLHEVRAWKSSVVPFLDDVPRGLFATRAPLRPNPIGMSLVRLLDVRGAVVRVEGIDVLDGTPLLDIKPYVGEFDRVKDARFGWLEQARRRAADTQADARFVTSDDKVDV